MIKESIEGRVRFWRSKDSDHIFCKRIVYTCYESKEFAGLVIENSDDFINEFLSKHDNIENKNIRLTLEIVE